MHHVQTVLLESKGAIRPSATGVTRGLGPSILGIKPAPLYEQQKHLTAEPALQPHFFLFFSFFTTTFRTILKCTFKSYLFPKSTQTCYPIPNGQPWKHTYDIIQTEQVVPGTITCIKHVIINEKKVMTERKGYIWGFGGRKKEKWYNFKNKEKSFKDFVIYAFCMSPLSAMYTCTPEEGGHQTAVSHHVAAGNWLRTSGKAAS